MSKTKNYNSNTLRKSLKPLILYDVGKDLRLIQIYPCFFIYFITSLDSQIYLV